MSTIVMDAVRLRLQFQIDVLSRSEMQSKSGCLFLPMARTPFRKFAASIEGGEGFVKELGSTEPEVDVSDVVVDHEGLTLKVHDGELRVLGSPLHVHVQPLASSGRLQTRWGWFETVRMSRRQDRDSG